MGERSFAEDVKQLGYGQGQVLRGEGILAITKALLQSGVSYVGGYPGAPILQERTHSAALKSSVPLLDPRNSLQSFARFVEEGFGLSEACNEPVLFSIRIRACHMRGTLECRDNVRPAISMRSPLEAPSFSLERINLPPFTYAMEARKFEQRLPAARRYILERELKALAHEARLDVEIQGKEVFSPHGEYVPALVIGGLRKFLVGANPTAQSVTAIEDRYAALTAHRETVRAALPEPVSKRPPSFCTGCPERPLFSAMNVLRTQDPSIGDNARKEPTGMTIPQALRGVGVSWIRTVDSYDIAKMIGTLREALTTRVKGLKVVIARGECQLERQRRLRPLNRARAAAGQTVVQPRFGVDPEVCTGDHSCMRLNGCPSLTLRESPDPLREDPIAHVDDTCVGCGVCGEVAHAAVLCPSFYQVRVIANPGPWTRLVDRLRRAAISALARA